MAKSLSDQQPRDGGSYAASVSKLNLYVSLTAGIMAIIYGYDLGSIASAILFLKPDFHLSDFEVSIVTSAVVLGQLIGAFSAGRISNAIGRKRTMVGVALGYAIFAALQGVAPEEWFLAVVRLLLGFAIGVSVVTTPAFIAESAPQKIRGSMLVTFQIATTSGIVIAYFVGAALASFESWRLILSLSTIPALIVLLFIIRLPESPRWLLMQNRRREAVSLLRQLNPDMDSETEADIIEKDLAHEEQGRFRELFQGRFRKAGVFVVGFGFLIQITGINAIIYYSPTVLQRVGVGSPLDAIVATGFAQIAGVMAEIFSFFLVDTWGRRPTLLTGIIITAIADLMLIIAFARGPSAILAFLGILIFTVGFGLGYGSLGWVYASESFPARLRTQGCSAMVTADLFANFLIGVVFLNALGALGGSTVFSIFLVLALFAVGFVYWLAPETKGRQLEAIRTYWYNGGHWPENTERSDEHENVY